MRFISRKCCAIELEDISCRCINNVPPLNLMALNNEVLVMCVLRLMYSNQSKEPYHSYLHQGIRLLP